MTAAPAPVRALGRLSLTAISLNTVIGAGIFALPGTVAQLLGPVSPVAYVASGLAVLLIVLCFAEAASRFERSGGPYIYAREAFGEFAGFEVGWIFLLARLTAFAAVSNVFADYLGYFSPALGQGMGRFLAITLLVVFLAGINYRGVRLGAAANNAFTIGKLLPLAVFCFVGLFFFDARTVSLTLLPAARPLQEASLLLLFALTGFENASIPSEEVVDPKRSVPFALIASVSLVVLLYTLIQVVAMSTLPDLADSATPLASAARTFLGPAGGVMLTIGAAISTSGNDCANLLIGPRVVYALAKGGQLPAALARLHPRYRTPAIAIVLYAFAGWALAVSGAFATLAAISALARLIVYTSTCLAVPVLRRKLRGRESQLRLPGGLSIPTLAVTVCAWLLAGSSPGQAALACLALAVGALLFFLMRGRSAGLKPGATASS
jgi:amino acid transporter